MHGEISEIARFLSGYAPEALVALESRHDDARAMLRPYGVVLGDRAPGLAVDAALAMLSVVAKVVADAAVATGDKLRFTARIELAGGFAGLLSSGGAIGAILARQSPWIAVLLGCLAFLSNAVPLLAKWLRGTVSGDGTIGQKFTRLRELVWDAQTLSTDLRRHADDGQKADELVGQANTLAREAYLLLSDLGYAPAFGPA